LQYGGKHVWLRSLPTSGWLSSSQGAASCAPR
jgi:hypothetical protein